MFTRLAALAFAGALFAAVPATAEEPADTGSGWTTIAPGGESSCAHGAPFEFHVKPGREDRLFFFLNGGGACWNGALCSLEEEPTPYFHISQIDENNPRKLGGVFDMTKKENPLKDWTQVFVSYCTGDVHLGKRDVTYDSWKEEFTVRHRGRRNVRAVLDWVYANVGKPERIFVAGSSAGAIAAPWYAVELAGHYREAGVSVLGDGAGGYREPAVAGLMQNWGFWDDAPDWTGGIDREAASFEDIWRAAAKAEPRMKMAQFDNAYDGAQEMFMRLLGNEERLYPLVAKNREELAEAIPGFASYVAGGTAHTLIRYDRFYDYEVDGVSAADWVAALAEGRDVESATCGEPEACETEPE